MEPQELPQQQHYPEEKRVLMLDAEKYPHAKLLGARCFRHDQDLARQATAAVLAGMLDTDLLANEVVSWKTHRLLHNVLEIVHH